MDVALRSRVEGGLVGLLVGDALGVPYEFHPPDRLPPREELEMVPPAGFRRAHGGVPAGTWSDDGALALALTASLLEHGALDLDDLGARMLAWFENGAYTPDGRVFDVGIQTSRALRAIAGGESPERSGPDEERANGNGSLMRVLPLALFHRGSLDELVHLAERQSVPTHRHPRSLVCCSIYSVWARLELEGRAGAFDAAVSEVRRVHAGDRVRLAEIDEHVRPEDTSPGTGTGYVVDTLRSARDLLRDERDFEGVVKGAVALGHDTDTTACVAGGIAGVRYGLEGIPERFRAALAGAPVWEPLLDRLLAARGLAR